MAHNSTIFRHLLKLVPRHEFEGLARKHKTGRMPRKLTRWDQFVAMGMAQLAGRCSLRDIVSNLSAQSRKLYHLGIGEVSRSSLARVNAEKPWELCRDLFGALLSRCRLVSPGHGFRFKNPLYSLDSTVLDLCLSAFPWATFRQTKGGLKAHVALDHAGHLPAFVTVTDAKTADIEAARSLRLPKGSIVVADRAYMDFKWIDSLILQGVFLVTRLKRRIRYRVVERREADRRRGVTSDQTIEFTSAQGRRQCPRRLRRIGYRDPGTGRRCFFLTTNFALSAKTIADIYKSRWQVELFFKWIKQNLKVPGRSRLPALGDGPRGHRRLADAGRCRELPQQGCVADRHLLRLGRGRGRLRGEHHVLLAAAAVAAYGWLSSVNMALSRGLLSTVVEPTMRGRVLSVDMMAHGFMPLGVIPVSLIAESAGIAVALGASGMAFAGSVLAVMTASPAVRRLDRWLRVARQRG